MIKLRNILFAGCVIAVSACTGYNSYSEVKALNEVQPVGSPFTQDLAAGYRDFSNYEQNEMFDYPDALHFARKGLSAAAGNVVLPEPISDWNLQPKDMNELSAAHGRLTNAFDMGARDVAPQQAANAQVAFDCWIEEQEEDWQTNNISTCKAKFMTAMTTLEGMLAPPPAPAPAPQAAAVVDQVDMPAAEPMKPEDAMYLVFFDFDSSKVGAGGQNVLDAVAQEVKSRDLTKITVTGYTDSSGPKAYNEKLAMKRANAVRDDLVSRGVDASLLKIESRGESDQLVKTADNVREPANRRVQITFE